MLGWFKKKFSRKDTEQQPETTAPEVEVEEIDVPEEKIEAGPRADEAFEQAPEVTETSLNEVSAEPKKENSLSAGDEAVTADDIVESIQADLETPSGFILDSELQQETEVDSSDIDAVLADVCDTQEENLADVRLESEAEEDAAVTVPETQTEADGVSPSDADEITHIDVEELEFVDEPSEVSEPESPDTDDEDVTVVDIADLEFQDTETEEADQQKGEVPEEILREIFPAPPPSEQEKPQRLSMFQRLQDRLGKTRDSFVYRLDALFLGKKVIDQELLDDLEEILITADLGVATTNELLEAARDQVKRDELSEPEILKSVLRDKILSFLQESDQPAELVMPESGPFVIMVVGVNGVGKTTTIGKIAAKFVDSGQSVLLVAGDTFRAAAIDQLKIWGDRGGVEVVAGAPGCDPSSVVFDGVARGVAEDVDVVLIDTAGRLHTSVNLMEELKKIRRVVGKKLESAPHEVMLVLDATTGQNAISQAKFFNEAVQVTGLAVTKLDGTAKGGIVANVCRELKIPVRFIGIGEQVDDLRDFDPEEFVQALFSQSEEKPDPE